MSIWLCEMSDPPELISIKEAFFKIEERVNSALPLIPFQTLEEFFSEESIEPEYREPDVIWLTEEFFGLKFVWQQSVELAWQFCKSANRVFVAKPGGVFEEVVTKNFCDSAELAGFTFQVRHRVSERMPRLASGSRGIFAGLCS